jgi:hypothetical protein
MEKVEAEVASPELDTEISFRPLGDGFPETRRGEFDEQEHTADSRKEEDDDGQVSRNALRFH